MVHLLLPPGVSPAGLPDSWTLVSERDSADVIVVSLNQIDSQDDLLEWANQNRVPVLAVMTSPALRFAPLPQGITKIACPGWYSALLLETAYGSGVCEVVGLPALDEYAPAPLPGENRLLILLDEADRLPVQDALDAAPGWNPLWGSGQAPLDAALRDVLIAADAVIAPPNFAALAAMRLRRPTAVWDMSHRMSSVQSAWTIRAPGQIPTILGQLRNPPPHFMLFQDEALQNQLEYAAPAAPRWHLLIETLAQAKQHSQPIPAHILWDDTGKYQHQPVSVDHRTLYPHVEVFQRPVSELQAEIASLESAVARYEDQLARDDVGSKLAGLAERLYRRVR